MVNCQKQNRLYFGLACIDASTGAYAVGGLGTGDYVVMAGQVGVRDHVHIGNRAVLGAMAGVTNDVPDGSRMIGIPATPEREQKIKQAALSKLPEMRRQLKKLQTEKKPIVN